MSAMKTRNVLTHVLVPSMTLVLLEIRGVSFGEKYMKNAVICYVNSRAGNCLRIPVLRIDFYRLESVKSVNNFLQYINLVESRFQHGQRAVDNVSHVVACRITVAMQRVIQMFYHVH